MTGPTFSVKLGPGSGFSGGSKYSVTLGQGQGLKNDVFLYYAMYTLQSDRDRQK